MLTLPTLITLGRIALIPVFAWLAVRYAASITATSSDEILRYTAVAVYVIAAASDGLDGYLARRLDQRTKLGAFLDPIADKGLLLTGLVTLSLVPWDNQGWRIPLWFLALVILRDCIILGGIVILYRLNGRVPIAPVWTGKVCTVTQLIALGWVMLKLLPFSPLYPAIVAAVFTVWSGVDYIRMGISQLPGRKQSR